MIKSIVKDNGCPIAEYDFDINLAEDSVIRITPEYLANISYPIGLAGRYVVTDVEFVFIPGGIVAEYNVEPLNEDEE